MSDVNGADDVIWYKEDFLRRLGVITESLDKVFQAKIQQERNNENSWGIFGTLIASIWTYIFGTVNGDGSPVIPTYQELDTNVGRYLMRARFLEGNLQGLDELVTLPPDWLKGEHGFEKTIIKIWALMDSILTKLDESHSHAGSFRGTISAFNFVRRKTTELIRELTGALPTAALHLHNAFHVSGSAHTHIIYAKGYLETLLIQIIVLFEQFEMLNK